MTAPRARSLLLLLPAALVLHACAPRTTTDEGTIPPPTTGENVQPGGLAAQREAFQRARATWDRAAPRDYRYTVERICFCTPDYRGPVTVTVRGGVPVSVTGEGGGTAEQFGTMATIPLLFDAIGRELAGTPAELHAEYDPQRGYPTSFSVDPSRQIADDERGFRVTGFQVLP